MFKRFNERIKEIAPNQRWKNCCYKAADLVAFISTLSLIYKVPIPVLSLPGYLIAGENAVIVFDSSTRSIGHFGILNLIFLPPAKAGFDFVDWENPRYPLNYFSMLYVIYCMYQSYQVFCESKQAAQVVVEFEPASSGVINIEICEEKTAGRKNNFQ